MKPRLEISWVAKQIRKTIGSAGVFLLCIGNAYTADTVFPFVSDTGDL